MDIIAGFFGFIILVSGIFPIGWRRQIVGKRARVLGLLLLLPLIIDFGVGFFIGKSVASSYTFREDALAALTQYVESTGLILGASLPLISVVLVFIIVYTTPEYIVHVKSPDILTMWQEYFTTWEAAKYFNLSESSVLELIQRGILKTTPTGRLHKHTLQLYNDLLEGMKYVQLGDYERARAMFSWLIKASPDTPLFYYLRAKSYYALRDDKNAFADFETVQKLSTDQELLTLSEQYTQEILARHVDPASEPYYITWYENAIKLPHRSRLQTMFFDPLVWVFGVVPVLLVIVVSMMALYPVIDRDNFKKLYGCYSGTSCGTVTMQAIETSSRLTQTAGAKLLATNEKVRENTILTQTASVRIMSDNTGNLIYYGSSPTSGKEGIYKLKTPFRSNSDSTLLVERGTHDWHYFAVAPDLKTLAVVVQLSKNPSERMSGYQVGILPLQTTVSDDPSIIFEAPEKWAIDSLYWTSDGKYLVLMLTNGKDIQIRKISLDGSYSELILNLKDQTIGPLSISLDNHVAAFAANADSPVPHLKLLDLHTHNLLPLRSIEANINGISWSHDGKKLLFESRNEGFSILDIASMQTHLLFPPNYMEPSSRTIWSPRDDYIFIVNSDVTIIDTEGHKINWNKISSFWSIVRKPLLWIP